MINEKDALIIQLRKVEKQFRQAINLLARDSGIENLFPNLYQDVLNHVSTYPTLSYQFPETDGGPRDALNDKEFALELFEYYKRFLNDLNKEVKAEKHDHHGVHGLLERLVRLSEAIVRLS